MYGYVTPDKPYLCFKDYALYRSFYCGTCLRVGKLYGQCPRMTTNYDATFLEVLLFSYLGEQPVYKDRACVLNPFKKKPTVVACDLLDRIAAFNLLLSYHNLEDDVIDGEGLKKMMPRRLLKRAYKRAKRSLPACEEIIVACYADLRETEKKGETSIDRACDPFGRMMRDGVAALVGDKTSENLEQFCYHLARYIYLMDALDDLEKDARKRSYNPFLAAFSDYTDRETFLAAHRDAIEGSIRISINGCIAYYERMGLAAGKNLLDNIVRRGLVKKFEAVLGGCKNCSKEKI